MKNRTPQYRTRIELLVEKGVEELLPDSFYHLSDSGVWMEEKNEVITMRFYPEDSDAFLRALKDSDLPVLEVHTEQEELKDYNALTKQYFRPIRIEGLTILPPWSKRKPIGPSLVIEPGMAFGTGRHESTRLMIKIMRSLDFKGATVLDLGCGSGILSLYAALLGAKTVVAVDNDLDTVLNARKNVTLNEARDIELVCADLTHVRGSYDVVLANLDIRTFTAHVPIVTAFTRPASKIVVSGILGRDRMKLISLFKPLELIRIEQKNSWRGFLFEVNSE